MCITALFIIAQRWNDRLDVHQLTNGYLNMRYTHTHRDTERGAFYSSIKMKFAVKWVELESMLNEATPKFRKTNPACSLS